MCVIETNTRLNIKLAASLSHFAHQKIKFSFCSNVFQFIYLNFYLVFDSQAIIWWHIDAGYFNKKSSFYTQTQAIFHNNFIDYERFAASKLNENCSTQCLQLFFVSMNEIVNLLLLLLLYSLIEVKKKYDTFNFAHNKTMNFQWWKGI